VSRYQQALPTSSLDILHLCHVYPTFTPLTIPSFITPTPEGYDRNHGPIPIIDASTHRVKIFGLVKNELSLSIDELKELPQHDVVCALQCAGNRRHTMRTKLKEVNGIDWFDGAVMNCKWSGMYASFFYFPLCSGRDYSGPLTTRLNFGRILQCSTSRRP
jgi:DMSO/TMAO reductase YedYZ molybdopterin-dependent catalytic subunit